MEPHVEASLLQPGEGRGRIAPCVQDLRVEGSRQVLQQRRGARRHRLLGQRLGIERRLIELPEPDRQDSGEKVPEVAEDRVVKHQRHRHGRAGPGGIPGPELLPHRRPLSG